MAMPDEHAVPTIGSAPFRRQKRPEGGDTALRRRSRREKPPKGFEQTRLRGFREVGIIFQGIGHAAKQVGQQYLAAQSRRQNLDIEREGPRGFFQEEGCESLWIVDPARGH